MPAVIPAIVVLICLVGIGATAANYVGMSPSEAFDYCKTHHDYSISETEFNSIYNEYHDNPDYAGVTITQQDVNKVTAAGSDLYSMAVTYGQTIALPYILGSFDQTWQPETGSREVKYYDDGVLVGSCQIYGFTNEGVIPYGTRSTPPELAYGDIYYLTLVFCSVDQQGNIYYHTEMFLGDDGRSFTSAISPADLGITDPQKVDRNASAVTFEAAANGRLVLNGDGNYFQNGVNIYPQVKDGVADVVPPEQDSIGYATTSDGQTIPVNPDGSITLPSGTTVYPDTTTGLYPSDITVHLDDDYWARLAEMLGANTATGSAAADTQTTNLNLEGLRSIASSTLDYLKNGFWTDFKNKLGEFFSIDTDKYRVSYQNPFTIIPSYVEKVCRIFGYQPSNS